jgi:hypothetical protein
MVMLTNAFGVVVKITKQISFVLETSFFIFLKVKYTNFKNVFTIFNLLTTISEAPETHVSITLVGYAGILT